MEDFTIKLTKEQRLVLFEFLCRIIDDEEDEWNEILYQDKSEWKVLLKIQGQLESALVEPFMSNYAELVEEARKKVREDF